MGVRQLAHLSQLQVVGGFVLLGCCLVLAWLWEDGSLSPAYTHLRLRITKQWRMLLGGLLLPVADQQCSCVAMTCAVG